MDILEHGMAKKLDDISLNRRVSKVSLNENYVWRCDRRILVYRNHVPTGAGKRKRQAGVPTAKFDRQRAAGDWNAGAAYPEASLGLGWSVCPRLAGAGRRGGCIHNCCSRWWQSKLNIYRWRVAKASLAFSRSFGRKFGRDLVKRICTNGNRTC